MTAAELKTQARQCGADLVGIAPAGQWAACSADHNPRSILPRCQAVIVVGRRILRGAFRGVEEGTSFGNTYGMYGVQWQEHEFLSRVIHQTASLLESAGAEAVPLFGGEADGTRQVIGPAGVAANVKLDCKALAHAAGLGALGKGGFFLTREYGHRQRFGLILTDLALEGDPLVDPGFCSGCDACLKACPLDALSDAGCAAFALDTQRCAVCANGKMTGQANAYERLDRLAASCGRACLVALEARIGNRFQAPFRRRSVWTRDIDGQATVHPLPGQGVHA